ncbi:MAG: ester cyclase [Calditrichaeota bacterium]|nr:ester cyclase [Calditrichota bacterium]
MKVKATVFSLLALFMMLASFHCQKKEDTSNSTEENKAAVRRLIDEAWNKGNLAVIDEILSPNYILHIDAPGANDREGYKQAISMYRTAMPDFQFTIDDMIAEGNKVVIRCTMTGTQKGELMGSSPTGKKLTMTAISIRYFENGKVIEEWVETNMLGFMQQMGIIPPPEQPQHQ